MIRNITSPAVLDGGKVQNSVNPRSPAVKLVLFFIDDSPEVKHFLKAKGGGEELFF